mmetsp:Transcript_30284/g.97623  ORF Transcript_30284/g.97623 Transcript_30284/m.97623 type:complete len:244 (+) Transcript_30284:116-847(+)
MKLLENQRLTQLTSFLMDREVSERIISGRVEAFSCKRAGEDKKLSKKLDQQYIDELASSPQLLSSSPLGALTDANARRLLIDLISTLNASFPDYDFSSLRPDQFTKDLAGPEFVVGAINRHLAELASHAALSELWSAVDDAVKLEDCQVYSYLPDLDSDPFSDGILWSFNYFFFNKHLKRIVYFTCVAKSKWAAAQNNNNANANAQDSSGDDFAFRIEGNEDDYDYDDDSSLNKDFDIDDDMD